MPSLPTAKRRPWQPVPQKREYQAHSERSPLYSTAAWQVLRLSQLKREPCCRVCTKQGRTTPATVADHVRPYRDGADFFDASNLQSLCRPCHQRKSAQEGHQKRAKP